MKIWRYILYFLKSNSIQPDRLYTIVSFHCNKNKQQTIFIIFTVRVHHFTTKEMCRNKAPVLCRYTKRSDESTISFFFLYFPFFFITIKTHNMIDMQLFQRLCYLFFFIAYTLFCPTWSDESSKYFTFQVIINISKNRSSLSVENGKMKNY